MNCANPRLVLTAEIKVSFGTMLSLEYRETTTPPVPTTTEVVTTTVITDPPVAVTDPPVAVTDPPVVTTETIQPNPEPDTTQAIVTEAITQTEQVVITTQTEQALTTQTPDPPVPPETTSIAAIPDTDPPTTPYPYAVYPLDIDLRDVRYQYQADLYWSFNTKDGTKFKNEAWVKNFFARTQAQVSHMDLESGSVWYGDGFVHKSIKPLPPQKACLTSPMFDTFTDPNDRYACIADPSMCQYGLSVSFWVKFSPEDLLSDDKRVLAGTDGEGYKVYHEGKLIKAEVWTKTRYWDVSYSLNMYRLDYGRVLSADRWINVAFVWNKEPDGLKLLIDGMYKGSTDAWFRHGSEKTRTQVPTKLYIGCEVVEGQTDPSAITNSEIDEFAIFTRRVRDGEIVIMTGGYLFRAYDLLPQTTTVSPESITQAKPLYDYANRMNLILSPDGSITDNDCYKIADKHWSLKESNVNALTKTGSVMSTMGRNGARSALKFGDAHGMVKLGTFASSCLGNFEHCHVNGFAVSIWFFIPEAFDSGDHEFVLAQSDFVDKIGWYFTYKNNQLHVKVSKSLAQDYAIPKEKTPKSSWLNVGFSWNKQTVPTTKTIVEVYVNGKIVQCQITAFVAEAVGTSRVKGDVSVGSSGKSAIGILASDMAYFNRYLYPVESYKLVGITREEYIYTKSIGFWTANEFLDRDTLSRRMYKLRSVPSVTLVPSHTPRGHAIQISMDEKDGWIVLSENYTPEAPKQDVGQMKGDLKCFSDLSMCKYGLTVTMWFKVLSYDSTSPSYLLSTGEQDYESRGVSMYLYNHRFYFGVVDNERIWKVSLPKSKVPQDTWCYMVASWSRNYGLWIAINGSVLSFNQEGAEDARLSDTLSRATLGRTNREAYFMGYSSYVFDTITYNDLYLETSQFRKYLSLIENDIYAKADYFWDADRMIASDINLLMRRKKAGNAGKPLGPSGKGIVQAQKWISVVDKADDYINLGLFEHECICNPDACTNGLTVAVWVKVPSTSEANFPLISCEPVSSVAKSSKPGFELIATTENKIQAKLRTKDTEWIAITSVVFDLKKWINVGFTWSQAEGLHIYVNGEAKGAKKDGTGLGVHLQADKANLLICNGDGTIITADYYQAVIWESYTYDSNAARMMGLSSLQEILFRTDYYWPFDGIVEDLYLGTIAPVLHSSSWVRDASVTGRAIRVTQRRQGWVSLGKHTDSCIVDPTKCKTLVILSLNVKLSGEQDGTLFSSGAQTAETKGFYIHQLANDSIEVLLADGIKVYKLVTGPVKLNKWQQIVVTWKVNEFKLMIGGETPTLVHESATDEARTKQTELVTLGRHNDDNVGFLDADFDEISFKFFVQHDQPTPDAAVIKRGGCYGTTEQIFYLDDADTAITKLGTTVGRDRFGENMALQTSPTGHIILGDYAKSCLSDPDRCGADGLAISLWIKLLDASPTSGDILCSGPPTTRGFLIKLKVGRKLQFRVLTATSAWSVNDVSIGDHNTWINLALRWSPSVGLVAYVNGTEKGADRAPSSSNQAADMYTTLYLGRTNTLQGGNQLAAIYDDVAVWRDARETGKTLDDVLQGICYDPVEEADPNAFTRPPPTSPLPTTPWTPPAGCDGTWTADRVCSTGDLEALQAMAAMEHEFSPESASVVSSQVVEASKTVDTAEGLEAMILLNEKVSNASVPGIVDEADFKREVQKMVDSTSNVIDKRNEKALEQLASKGLTEKIVNSVENFVLKWVKTLPGRMADNCTKIPFYAANTVVDVYLLRLSICKHHSLKFPSNIEKVSQTLNDDEEESTARKRRSTVTSGPASGEMEVDLSAAYANSSTTLVVRTFGAVYTNLPKAMRKTTDLSDPKIGGKSIEIGSNIMVFTVYPPIQPIIARANFKLVTKNTYLVRRTEHNVSVYCAYMSEEELKNDQTSWKTEGSYVTTTKVDSVSCQFNHLTHFAVLMDPIPVEEKSLFEIILSIVMYVCLIISIISMVVLFFCIAVHSDLITERNVIHMNLAIAMIFGNLSYILNEVAMPNEYFCRVISVFIHFFYTAAYMWLFVESLYVFYAITNGVLRGRLRCYLPLCWGLPLVLVAATAGSNISAYGWERYCWLVPTNNYIYAFIGPILLLIVCTAAVLMIIICNLPTPAIKKEEILRELRRLTRDSLLLIVVLCITWTFATVVIWNQNEAILFCFTALFCLQGLFMFLVIISGSQDVKRHLTCFPCCRKRGVGNRKASAESMVGQDVPDKTEVFYMGPVSSANNACDGDNGSLHGEDGAPKHPPPKSRNTTTTSQAQSVKSPPPVYVP